MESAGWNFYSLPGFEISKWFSRKFFKKLHNLSYFFENLQENYFEIS